LEKLQELKLNMLHGDFNSAEDPAVFQFNRDVFRLMPQLKVYYRIDPEYAMLTYPEYTFKDGLVEVKPCSMEEFAVTLQDSSDM